MNRVQMFSMAAGLAVSGSALAGTVSELNVAFDVVRAEVTAGAFPRNPANTTGVNGSVQLTAKLNTVMAVIVDGFKQPNTKTVSSIVAHFDIAGGDVTSGNFLVTLSDASFFSCQANSRALAGTDLVWSGGENGSYRVDGDISNFLLSGALFGDVDVQVFYDNQPLIGSFFDFAFRPSTEAGAVGAFDEATQLGFVVATSTVIPLPTSVGMAGMGLLGLAGVRRRRMA